jgi:hypothetical protein
MKQIITLTTDDGESWLVPIAAILDVIENTDKDRQECDLSEHARTFVETEQSNHHVRESPSQIAALIREAQAPSVDEISVQVLAHLAAATIGQGGKDQFKRDAEALSFGAHEIALIHVAERARRNAPKTEPKITGAELLATTDARVWAAGFRETALSLGYSDMDEGWLISWFANAMCAQMDADARRNATASTPASPGTAPQEGE